MHEATRHAFHDLETARALILAGGVAVYLLGDVLFRSSLGLGRNGWRLACAAAVLLTVPLGTAVAAEAQIVALVALLVACFALERRPAASRCGCSSPRTGNNPCMQEIRVYTRAGCGWCGAVKSLLRKHEYHYREIRADEDEDAMRFLAQQLAFTVPQVFVGERRIGGYEATVEAIISGEFERLLADDGAGDELSERARLLVCPRSADVVRLCEPWPEVEQSTSYGTPALKVRGRSFCRLWGERRARGRSGVEGSEVLVVFCELEWKQTLLDGGSDALFTTPHSTGTARCSFASPMSIPRDLHGYLETSYLLEAPPSVRRRPTVTVRRGPGRRTRAR